MRNGSPWLNQLSIILDTNLIHENLGNQILADTMHIRERQFYRKVKKMTGLSPNQFIPLFRLERAMTFIQKGDYLTVQEIALAIGYQNLYYFSKIFEKEYDITPMQLLKKLGRR